MLDILWPLEKSKKQLYNGQRPIWKLEKMLWPKHSLIFFVASQIEILSIWPRSGAALLRCFVDVCSDELVFLWTSAKTGLTE